MGKVKINILGFTLSILGFVLVTSPQVVFAQDLSYGDFNLGERIEAFDVTIDVNQDRSISVEERILYNTGGLQKHGIFRDIYQDSATGERMSVVNLSVSDEFGNMHMYEHSSGSDGLSLKIGDPNATFSGQKTYVIKYKATKAATWLEEKDEIYWNATGHGWPFPITRSSVTVNIPKEMSPNSSACYGGYFGDIKSCIIHKDESNYKFIFDEKLEAYQGLTIALGFDKGYLLPPSFSEILYQKFITYGPYAIVVIVFLISFLNWFKNGRDPKKIGAIVPQYNPPEDLEPYSLGFLMGKVSTKSKALASQIIYLAINGYIQVIQKAPKDSTGKNDFSLKLLRRIEHKNSVSGFLIDALFPIVGYKEGMQREISEIGKDFHYQSPKLENISINSMIDKGYYVKDPRKILISYRFVGYPFFALGFLLIGFAFFAFGSALVLSGLIICFFGYFAPKVTNKGADVIHHLKGLEMYLSIAEKERINFHNAPEKNPEVFEKLLPYAILFGVEKAWAREFEEIYTKTPNWYSGSVSNNFSAISFTDSMSNFGKEVYSGLNLSGVSQGGGGSGGGGSSGGGGGGGGGGSW